jgi:hypothetical protein
MDKIRSMIPNANFRNNYDEIFIRGTEAGSNVDSMEADELDADSTVDECGCCLPEGDGVAEEGGPCTGKVGEDGAGG